VRLEEHVAHHLRHQLVLLLRDGGAGRGGAVRQNVEHLGCAVQRGGEGGWGGGRRTRTSLEMSICASSSLVAMQGEGVGGVLAVADG
jgi:hypothetical protein